MIVWGGRDSLGRLDTGGLYDPATDAWTGATAVIGRPSARSNHTAVWTGNSMIVWGGFNGAPLGTGARYRPGTNSWQTTSTAGSAPAARYDHSAVWTGSRMIVWGGITSQSIDTGALYDPLTDTWSPTSTWPGVPSARTQHSAVWTGSRMIIWGGEDPLHGNSMNTGSLFDPATNAWTTVIEGPNTLGAYGATALWTGSRLLEWGGHVTSGVTNQGGRYDPAGDGWTVTSTGAGCPQGRSAQAGVWTGTRMIVWGGGPLTGTGGVYCGCSAYGTVYRDSDRDGYGDPGSPLEVCTGYQPAGYVADGSDCNDASTFIHPGATEVCDGLDNNCDGSVDNVAAPASTPMLEVGRTGPATAQLTWSYGTGDQTFYDVVRGDLLVLASSGGSFAAATTDCLGSHLISLLASDSAVPASGSGSWYLVRAVNCGGRGTYDSGAPSQVGSRDPGIAASGHDCP
jgi:hypothetical protein